MKSYLKCSLSFLIASTLCARDVAVLERPHFIHSPVQFTGTSGIFQRQSLVQPTFISHVEPKPSSSIVKSIAEAVRVSHPAKGYGESEALQKDIDAVIHAAHAKGRNFYQPISSTSPSALRLKQETLTYLEGLPENAFQELLERVKVPPEVAKRMHPKAIAETLRHTVLVLVRPPDEPDRPFLVATHWRHVAAANWRWQNEQAILFLPHALMNRLRNEDPMALRALFLYESAKLTFAKLEVPVDLAVIQAAAVALEMEAGRSQVYDHQSVLEARLSAWLTEYFRARRGKLRRFAQIILHTSDTFDPDLVAKSGVERILEHPAVTAVFENIALVEEAKQFGEYYETVERPSFVAHAGHRNFHDFPGARFLPRFPVGLPESSFILSGGNGWQENDRGCLYAAFEELGQFLYAHPGDYDIHLPLDGAVYHGWDTEHNRSGTGYSLEITQAYERSLDRLYEKIGTTEHDALYDKTVYSNTRGTLITLYVWKSQAGFLHYLDQPSEEPVRTAPALTGEQRLVPVERGVWTTEKVVAMARELQERIHTTSPEGLDVREFDKLRHEVAEKGDLAIATFLLEKYPLEEDVIISTLLRHVRQEGEDLYNLLDSNYECYVTKPLQLVDRKQASWEVVQKAGFSRPHRLTNQELEIRSSQAHYILRHGPSGHLAIVSTHVTEHHFKTAEYHDMDTLTEDIASRSLRPLNSDQAMLGYICMLRDFRRQRAIRWRYVHISHKQPWKRTQPFFSDAVVRINDPVNVQAVSWLRSRTLREQEIMQSRLLEPEYMPVLDERRGILLFLLGWGEANYKMEQLGRSSMETMETYPLFMDRRGRYYIGKGYRIHNWKSKNFFAMERLSWLIGQHFNLPEVFTVSREEAPMLFQGRLYSLIRRSLPPYLSTLSINYILENEQMPNPPMQDANQLRSWQLVMNVALRSTTVKATEQIPIERDGQQVRSWMRIDNDSIPNVGSIPIQGGSMGRPYEKLYLEQRWRYWALDVASFSIANYDLAVLREAIAYIRSLQPEQLLVQAEFPTTQPEFYVYAGGDVITRREFAGFLHQTQATLTEDVAYILKLLTGLDVNLVPSGTSENLNKTNPPQRAYHNPSTQAA